MDRRDFFSGLTTVRAPKPGLSLGAKYYTNAVLRNQDGQQLKFYDDVIKDKHVLINLMYTNCKGACTPITARLRKVQEALGDRMGRDIFMYSISLKPQEDGPAELKRYAEMHGAKPGWEFLTGEPFDITTIRFRLMRWRHPGRDLNITQHSRMLRVINDKLNRWSGCSALASLDTIMQVVSFVEPIEPIEVRMRENAIAQAEIDKADVLPTWLGSLGKAHA
jgi:protein SCO1/2